MRRQIWHNRFERSENQELLTFEPLIHFNVLADALVLPFPDFLNPLEPAAGKDLPEIQPIEVFETGGTGGGSLPLRADANGLSDMSMRKSKFERVPDWNMDSHTMVEEQTTTGDFGTPKSSVDSPMVPARRQEKGTLIDVLDWTKPPELNQAGNIIDSRTRPHDEQEPNGNLCNESSAYPSAVASWLTASPRAEINVDLIQATPSLKGTDRIPYVDDCKQEEFSKARFFWRTPTEQDMPVIRDLHKECFPIEYSESFFTSIHTGAGGRTKIVCWKSDPDTNIELEPDQTRIAGFATSSVYSSQNPALLSPVKYPVAVRELTSLISHLAQERLRVYLRQIDRMDVLENRFQELDDVFTSAASYLWTKFDFSRLIDHSEYIKTLGVMQEFRGKGLGKGIVDLIKDDADARGVEVLGLHVVAYNDAALQMYKKMGFLILDLYENFYSIADELYDAYLAFWIPPEHHPILDEAVSILLDDVLLQSAM